MVQELQCSSAVDNVLRFIKLLFHRETQISFEISGTPRPRYPVTQNITVYKALNKSVTLNLTLIAYPEPSPEEYHWEKISGTSTTNITNGANVNISVVNQESRFTIHSLQQKDFGQYRLVITYNVSRSYSHYFFICPQGTYSSL